MNQPTFNFSPQGFFKPLKNEFRDWSLIGIILGSLTYTVDQQAFDFIDTYIRNPILDEIIIFTTEKLLYAIIGLFFLTTIWRVWRNPNHHSKLISGAFSLLVTGIVATILKQWFDIPRPFQQISTLTPLVDASLNSFPSAHAAVSFALLIPLYRINHWLGFFWGSFAIFVGMARVYEMVHFPSDIAGGIWIGGLIGALFSNKNTEKILIQWWQQLEFRRQSFHFVAGFMAVYLHWLGIFRWRIILVLLIGGMILSAISAKRNIPVISSILTYFDRPRDRKFPGRGAFYLLLGIFLSIIIFPVKIAYASILILAVGDSLNHLFFDRAPKKLNLPWNRKKSLLGLTLGIMAGTFAAQFFVPIYAALLASMVSLVVETFYIKLGNIFIDDNILVPLIAGAVLMVV
jgi:undecaprenyl-diphosphatase